MGARCRFKRFRAADDRPCRLCRPLPILPSREDGGDDQGPEAVRVPPERAQGAGGTTKNRTAKKWRMLPTRTKTCQMAWW